MDLVLIRLSRGGQHAGNDNLPPPEVVADIVWANATRGDQLEHIRARAGPEPGCVDLVLFHRAIGQSAAGISLALCRRAVDAAPSLAGCTTTPLTDPEAIATITAALRRDG
jgi:hypothetical protein